VYRHARQAAQAAALEHIGALGLEEQLARSASVIVI